MNKTILKNLLCSSFFLMSATIMAQVATVSSPDARLKVNLDVKGGKAVYSVSYDDKTMLEESPLGFKSNFGDFSTGLSLRDHQEGKEYPSHVQEKYHLNRCKVSDVDYEANVYTLCLKAGEGRRQLNVDVVFYVSNNDIAFRYEVPRHGETGSIRIMSEETGFRFPQQTTTFMCPQSDAMVGWKRTKPSYEEGYSYDRPLAETKARHGFTFPCLFKIGEDGWVLVSETGNDSRYCGCRLSDLKEGNLYTVDFPMPEEANGNGTIEPAFALPGATPWRTITVGKTLAPIVETTAPWNTVRPLYGAEQNPSKGDDDILLRTYSPKNYKFGKSTWSWIVWQDASMNWDDQVAYIDLASEMGYPYILIDAGWDEQLGYKKMEDLIKYAHIKNVDVFLWYSSSGYWNDIVQSPINKMDGPIARKEVMRWMKKNGVKGIKVDFWGGDKQETFRQYEAVLSDAYDNDIMVIFHGCTLPRGWERMYPNYVGSEAVLASENLVFSQGACDKEAKDTSTHPFIRNTVGCMEWGGSFLNRRLGRGNQRGPKRATTDCHELAQAVLFQNPIQNFAITPENLKPESEGGAPKVSIDFMKMVPTTWNETKYVAGYPGQFAVLARRNADTWYIAGNNASDECDKVLDLSRFVKKGDVVTLFSDDANSEPQRKEVKIKNPKKVKVHMLHNGGFVIVK